MVNILIIILRLVVAFVLGGLVGYQRERSERTAGLRTHVLVALGAAVFTIISITPFSESPGAADPSRIAAQVVIGIGFIGAGAIINQGDIILGLTTAASLWVTASVGVAIGAGYYTVGLAATLLTYIALSFFKWIERKMGPGKEHGMLSVILKDGRKQLFEVEKVLKNVDVRSKDFELNKDKTLNEYRFFIEIPVLENKESLVEKIIAIDGVQKVRWEGLLTGRI